MKAKELKYDIDAINAMKDTLAKARDSLETCKNNVNTSLEKLKTDWNTAAGKQFFKEVDTDWGDEVKRYKKVLETVEGLLEEASTQYQKVTEKVEELKF